MQTHLSHVTMPSDRSFGLTIGGILILIGLFIVNLWLTGVGLVLVLAGLLKPSWLHTPNKLWFYFGLLLGRITTPIILGILFFGFITPLALLMRLFGKRFLALRFEPDEKTYWIARHPAGPDPKTLQYPF